MTKKPNWAALPAKLSVLMAAICLLLPSVGCKKRLRTDHSDHLQVSGFVDPDTFDWNRENSGAGLVDAITAPLIRLTSKGGLPHLAPGLVTKWESSRDGIQWTLTLREGVKWSDGQPLTPQQVVDSFARLLNPKTGAQDVQDYLVIENAKVFYEGSLTDFSQVGIEILKDKKIRFKLQNPTSFFPNLLTNPAVSPIRMDLMGQPGSMEGDPIGMVTLGPYQVVERKRDVYSLLARNPHYYGPPAKAPKVKVHTILSALTGTNLFEAGKVDLQLGLPAQNLKALQKTPHYRQQDNFALGYIAFNLKKSPMDNPHLRQAIARAIDPREVVKVLGGGKAAISTWMPNLLVSWDQPNQESLFNPAKARALLEKAGYLPNTLPKIQLLHHTYKNHQLMCENIQFQLKKNLGIDVEIVSMEWKSFLSKVKTDPPQIHRLGATPSVLHPVSVLSMVSNSYGSIKTGWHNEQYEQLLLKAMNTTEKEVLIPLVRKALELIRSEVPVVPIYSGTSLHLVSKRISSLPERYSSNFLANIPFKKDER